MCGICGFYDYKTRDRADRHVLDDMLNVIRHRGPDDCGEYLDQDVALGMRRLSIIDLSGGKQPISNEDGTIVTVFNGEIYNFQALREQLSSRGHALRTASDTEVIVHLYEDFGEDCVQHLRGMFGFALWDARRRRLLVTRDRLGIKPLYFAVSGGRLIFGSEIKAILQHPAAQVHLNIEGLSKFLSLKYVPAPQTMFEGVYALPPGCSLTCDANGIKIRRYWDVSFTNPGTGERSEESYAEQLDALLRECVKLHLVSDVPFGAFLSGGLDSSTIVALMSQFLNEPVKTYSVGFQGDAEAFSELPYARMVAKKYETDHHEVFIRPHDLINLSEKVVWHLDQPVADEACLANYMVAELASRQVKMVLTGEGGDELFAGYARYAGERLSPLFQHLPRAAKSVALAASGRLPGLRRQKVALYALCQPDEVNRLVNWFPLFNSEAKQALLSEDVKQYVNGGDASAVFAEHLARTDATGPLNRMLYVDTKLWLPDDLLARGDKMSMAASLEARVPLLDHQLVEFAASLPQHLKVKGLTRKYLLRKVGQTLLPPEIIRRKKKGFPMPVSLWFRKEARSFLRDVLSPSALQRRGLFNPAFVEKLLSEHENGFADHGSLLWGLLSIELWQRVFMDSRQRPERLAAFAAQA
ncbi:MAG: asparagine synthase (glutamine-hydrolyzing) [Acidobacteria bacterium 13_1_20CM_58_21]|nr:MAG: asparagine synthase (glutamine-hydrolyzing) [Acidobacteria bacterium 13_1_20CM_58_21]